MQRRVLQTASRIGCTGGADFAQHACRRRLPQRVDVGRITHFASPGIRPRRSA
jgi:hypothetical protein